MDNIDKLIKALTDLKEDLLKNVNQSYDGSPNMLSQAEKCTNNQDCQCFSCRQNRRAPMVKEELYCSENGQWSVIEKASGDDIKNHVATLGDKSTVHYIGTRGNSHRYEIKHPKHGVYHVDVATHGGNIGGSTPERLHDTQHEHHVSAAVTEHAKKLGVAPEKPVAPSGKEPGSFWNKYKKKK